MTDWPGRSFVVAILVFPLLVVLGGIAWWMLRSLAGRAPVDAEVARRGRSALLGQGLRQGFAWTLGPVERMFLAGGASPDALTIAGTAMCGAGALVVAAGDLTVGGLLCLGSSAFDFLDGRLARRRGLASAAGEFLDSTLDRYADAFCFGAAAFLLRGEPSALAASLAAFGAAGIVPYARAKAEALGATSRSGLMQRPERMVLYSAAAIFSAPLDPWVGGVLASAHPTFAAAQFLLAVATVATAIGRTREALSVLRAAAPASRAPRPQDPTS